MLNRSRLGLQPGTQGSQISVLTNSFAITSLPANKFYHYDEFPGFDRIPKRDRCLLIYDKLMAQFPDIFTSRAAYDGQKNMFTSFLLKLSNNAAQFNVYMGNVPSQPQPNLKPITVKIIKVTDIDPTSILDVLNGKGSHSSGSLTVLTLLNILVRMKPIMSHPSNSKSFFTKDFRSGLGKGLELWRGLFQSVRPTIGRLIVNIDIATAVMYVGGSLVETVLAFIGSNNARDLSRVTEIQQRKLDQFLKGLLIGSKIPPRRGGPRWRKVLEIVMTGADDYMFLQEKTGENTSISKYYEAAYRYHVQLGKAICISVGKGIVFPIEVLEVKPGQIFKRTLTSDLAARALKFSTVKPADRIKAIQSSASALGYRESDFLRHSGVTINESLLSVNARVLHAPSIQWGSSQAPDTPRGGAWNVVGKKLWQPAKVRAWAVVNYEHRRGSQDVLRFLANFVEACKLLGQPCSSFISVFLVAFPDSPPEDMEDAAKAAMGKFCEGRPSFILVILPDSAIDIRTAVKSWGDCKRGCRTQCMKGGKLNGNNQYCNNLALKLNTKLGGINSIPAKNAPIMKVLSQVPTMIIGADVSHAAPDSDRPSVTGLVSSVDQYFSRYVASTKIQTARQEIISELGDMANRVSRNVSFSTGACPSRGTEAVHTALPIISCRDGVSEGQFEAVGKDELNEIKSIERQFGGTPPVITFIIVGKKHHVRFFPKDARDGDRSGNCPPGMVVDRDIVSPVDYDFYLQSHGGLLGTSRPSHYSVIDDGNDLGADNLQAISYLLCHVYARATRSVSIPAPVYYADIVCARGRFHSTLIHDGTESAGGTVVDGKPTLEAHQKAFKGIATDMRNTMYFM
ncbi:argonaute-like protein [Hysterangium stoloniferum]|nr:argonaute-like protein [Hysterangium stoloniferum]